MTVFKTKEGKEISAADFCKSKKSVPARWARQAESEKPTKAKSEGVKDANTDTK